MKLNIRYAKKIDILPIYYLANEPYARKMSFNQDIIEFKTHEKYLNEIFKKNDIHLLVIHNNENEFVGYFKIDQFGIISINIADRFRNKKKATKIINKSIKQLKGKLKVKELIAYIKVKNLRALRSVKKANFKFDKYIYIKNEKCYKMVYRID